MKTKANVGRPRNRVKKQVRRRNKWWRPAHGVTATDYQWESVLHPDFLFVAVYGCRFVARTGNRSFDLTGTKPREIHVATSPKEAAVFARKWIRKHSGRDYCEKACELRAQQAAKDTPSQPAT